jgi:hypothetical protein
VGGGLQQGCDGEEEGGSGWWVEVVVLACGVGEGRRRRDLPETRHEDGVRANGGGGVMKKERSAGERRRWKVRVLMAIVGLRSFTRGRTRRLDVIQTLMKACKYTSIYYKI